MLGEKQKIKQWKMKNDSYKQMITRNEKTYHPTQHNTTLYHTALHKDCNILHE